MPAPWEIRFEDKVVTATTGGSGSWNSPVRVDGHLVGVRVRPPTAAVIYDVSITEYDGFVVYRRRGVKGELSEDMVAPVAIRGIVTVSVANGTADGTYFVKLVVA